MERKEAAAGGRRKKEKEGRDSLSRCWLAGINGGITLACVDGDGGGLQEEGGGDVCVVCVCVRACALNDTFMKLRPLALSRRPFPLSSSFSLFSPIESNILQAPVCAPSLPHYFPSFFKILAVWIFLFSFLLRPSPPIQNPFSFFPSFPFLQGPFVQVVFDNRLLQLLVKGGGSQWWYGLK